MFNTAKKIVPAVAVVAVLGTGLASAATIGGPAANRTTASSVPASARVDPDLVGTSASAVTAPPGRASMPPASSSPLAPSTTPEDETAAPSVPAAAHEPGGGSLANCSAGEGTYRPSTETEFRAAMTGIWILCERPSFFGTHEAGLEVRADGRWNKLERTPSGALARSGGWDNEGGWSTYDTSAMNGPFTYQINFHVDGGGTSYDNPSFGEGSSSSRITKVRMHSMSGVADYVPAPEGTNLRPAPFPPAPGKGCEAREESYTPTTEAEFRSAMIGTWLICAKPTFFGSDEDGLEIRSDGRWSKLYRASNHSLVRGRGAGDEGTWNTIDTSSMNGRPTYQINFNVDEGYASATPALAGEESNVTKIRLDNSGYFIADYIPASPATTVIGP